VRRIVRRAGPGTESFREDETTASYRAEQERRKEWADSPAELVTESRRFDSCLPDVKASGEKD
jgi:hypothetical protein